MWRHSEPTRGHADVAEPDQSNHAVGSGGQQRRGRGSVPGRESAHVAAGPQQLGLGSELEPIHGGLVPAGKVAQRPLHVDASRALPAWRPRWRTIPNRTLGAGWLATRSIPAARGTGHLQCTKSPATGVVGGPATACVDIELVAGQDEAKSYPANNAGLVCVQCPSTDLDPPPPIPNCVDEQLKAANTEATLQHAGVDARPGVRHVRRRDVPEEQDSAASLAWQLELLNIVRLIAPSLGYCVDDSPGPYTSPRSAPSGASRTSAST